MNGNGIKSNQVKNVKRVGSGMDIYIWERKRGAIEGSLREKNNTSNVLSTETEVGV